MSEELVEQNEQVEISKINGRTQIVFKKAILKGKVSQSEVFNTLLIAAKLQGEYYIKKLSKGAPLDPAEVKCLKELSEIAKLQVTQEESRTYQPTVEAIDTVKSTLYAALAEKLKDS